MLKSLRVFLYAVCFMVLIVSATGAITAESVTIDPSLKAITTYNFGDNRESLTVVADMVTASLSKPDELLKLEKQFALILISKDATYAGKDFICRQLYKIGTKESVPALSALLMDEKTSDIARYALQQYIAPEAGKALISAAGKLTGKSLVGVVNSIGERGDEKAIGVLGKVLSGKDEAGAVAAANALGKIGTAKAVALLEKSRTNQNEKIHRSASMALLLCADNLMAKGSKDEAASIFRSLCSRNEAKQIRKAALLGLESYLSE